MKGNTLVIPSTACGLWAIKSEVDYWRIDEAIKGQQYVMPRQVVDVDAFTDEVALYGVAKKSIYSIRSFAVSSCVVRDNHEDIRSAVNRCIIEIIDGRQVDGHLERDVTLRAISSSRTKREIMTKRRPQKISTSIIE